MTNEERINELEDEISSSEQEIKRMRNQVNKLRRLPADELYHELASG